MFLLVFTEISTYHGELDHTPVPFFLQLMWLAMPSLQGTIHYWEVAWYVDP